MYISRNVFYFKDLLRETYGRPENTEAKRQKITQEITVHYNKNGKWKMKQVEHVNILLIGRVRTGKTTIKSLLVNPTTVPKDLTLKADTKDPNFQAFHLQEKNTVLNVIDTPGLFERSNNEIDIRDNVTILTMIKACAYMEIVKFHAICFCVSLTSGINQEDIESIKALIKYFGKETSKNSCLIITHCESKTEEQRQKLKQELVQDTDFKKIAPFFQLGILFSGAINPDDYTQGSDNVYRQYFNIIDYRIQLINMFLSVKDPLPIDRMNLRSAPYDDDLNMKIAGQLRNSEELLAAKDRTIKELQVKVDAGKRQIQRLKGNYNITLHGEANLRSQAKTQSRYECTCE